MNHNDLNAARHTLRFAVGVASAFVFLCFSDSLFGADALKTSEAWQRVPADLRYDRITIPEAENAFPLWQQAAEKFVQFHGDAESLETFTAAWNEKSDFPGGVAKELIISWLDRNRDALNLLDAGLKRSRCQFPRSNPKM